MLLSGTVERTIMDDKRSPLPILMIRVGALIAGYATLTLSILITVEVLGRKLFNFSFQGVDEIGGYVLAIGVSFSLAYSLIMRANTRVDVLVNKLPSVPRALFNLAAALLIAAFAVFLCWQSYAALSETIEFDSHASTPLQTPLWIPQSIWVIGFALFALTAFVYAANGVRLLVTGKIARLNSLLGPRTADDELAEALEEIQEPPRPT